ncbi:hypothetical protein F4780DRAFT_237718 [Xylariomycetidae sp. FL0641]|nr:hypothetical protein F4780DRAFT_237718 [Xylariomycetidae sp. FL0641]
MNTCGTLFALSLNNLVSTDGKNRKTPSTKDIFLRQVCLKKSLLSLMECFSAIFITGNSLISGLRPGVCCFVFLWPWLVTPCMALYQDYCWRTLHTSGTHSHTLTAEKFTLSD